MKSPIKTVGLLGLFLFCPRLAILAAPAGYVVYWGNAPGASGHNSTGVVEIRGQIVTNATALAAGNGSALAVRSDSTVVGWGWNNHGQATGVPTAEPTSGEVRIHGQILSNVVAVSAEWIPVLALRDDGAVLAWGGESEITNDNRLVSLCGQYHLGVRADGSVIDLLSSKPVVGLSNVVMIAARQILNGGGGGIVALKKDGTVVKSNFRDEPLDIGISNVVAIASGEWQTLALTKEGTVVGIGGEDKVPEGLSNVLAIAVGRSHSLGLRRNGTVVAWDAWEPSYIRAAQVPSGLSNVVAIAAGSDYSLAITTNRVVAERFQVPPQ